MIPVKGNKGLYRDESSGAIINCNKSEYEEHLKLKNKIKEERLEVKKIKEELQELKELVKKLTSDIS